MSFYTLIDLEWTSWKNNYYGKHLEKEKRHSWQKKEIIQIGGLKFNDNYEIKGKLNIIVKPEINKKLSKYITKLTAITDTTIQKKGLKFTKALKLLKKFSKKSLLLSNGTDISVLKENIKLHKIKSKRLKIFNIKKILEKKYQIPKKYLSSPILKSYFGYKINDKITHNAIYDCYSVFLSMKKMKFDLSIIDKKHKCLK